MAVDLIKSSRSLSQILIMIGLWPKDADEASRKWYTRFVRCSPLLAHVPLTFTYLTLMCVDVIVNSDPTFLKDYIFVLLTEIGMLVKMFCFLRNAKLVDQMLHHWQTHDIYSLQSTQEHLMWSRAQSRFSVISLLYRVCSLSSAITPMVLVLCRESNAIPFPYWLPFDLQQPRNFWIAYVYELLVMPLTCLTNVVLDMLYSYIILHVGLCLHVIGMRLEQVGQSQSDEEVTQRLTAAIQLHQLVKRCAHNCEIIVSYPILAQVLISSFVLCFAAYGLQTVHIAEDPNAFSFMVQYAIAMTLQCFLPCYYANEINIASQKLSGKLYASQWVGMSRSNRRMILLYMEYLKKPIILRAGYILDIGLPLFSKTLNNAYSLLALLLNMDN